MTMSSSEINTEEIKKEIKQELIKREILMGIDSDEIDLFETAKTVLRHYLLVFVLPIVVSVLAVVYALSLPPFFKAKASIFVHSKSGGGGLSSILGSLPFGGGLSGIGGGGSAEYLMTYLKSEVLVKEIIGRLNIATEPVIVGENPKEFKWDDMFKTMSQIVDCSKDKDGLITISAETKSATFSAQIVEAYLDVLNKFSKGPGKQKRLFIESQLAKISRELEDAEQRFKAFQDKNKLVSIDQESKGIIDQLIKLESERVGSDITLKMQQGLLKASGNLPELVKIESQKVSEEARQEALIKAIAEIEKKLAEVPSLSLDFSHLTRELGVKTKVFGTLTEQLEMAKIAEAEEGSQFEIIDHARVPDRKSKPSRAVIVIMAVMVAGVIGIFLAFFKEFLDKALLINNSNKFRSSTGHKSL